MIKNMDKRHVASASVVFLFAGLMAINMLWVREGGSSYYAFLLQSSSGIAVVDLERYANLERYAKTDDGPSDENKDEIVENFDFENSSLSEVFQTMGWRRNLVADSVLTAIPPNIRYVEPVSTRKRLFFGIVLPVAIRSLEKVLRTRAFLLDAVGEELNDDENRRVEGLCKIYRVKSSCDLDSLLLRVDVLPISLVLAQAAIESGWGSSRFAQEGNALFGQWTTAKGQGIVPIAREEGKSHKIRSYNSIEDSVDSYLRNVNSHPVYRGLRQSRSEFRKAKPNLGGYLEDVEIIWSLLPHLKAYSEKGEVYIDLLKAVINDNQLIQLDRLLLDFVG